MILNAMRNFRAPVTVAPQLGTKELGPKSGIHSACLSCGNIHLGVRRRDPVPTHIPQGMGERGRWQGGHPLTPRHICGGAPSQAGPRTLQPGWPGGSDGWVSELPHHRGTLQRNPTGQVLSWVECSTLNRTGSQARWLLPASAGGSSSVQITPALLTGEPYLLYTLGMGIPIQMPPTHPKPVGAGLGC